MPAPVGDHDLADQQPDLARVPELRGVVNAAGSGGPYRPLFVHGSCSGGCRSGIVPAGLRTGQAWTGPGCCPVLRVRFLMTSQLGEGRWAGLVAGLCIQVSRLGVGQQRPWVYLKGQHQSSTGGSLKERSGSAMPRRGEEDARLEISARDLGAARLIARDRPRRMRITETNAGTAPTWGQVCVQPRHRKHAQPTCDDRRLPASQVSKSPHPNRLLPSSVSRHVALVKEST